MIKTDKLSKLTFLKKNPWAATENDEIEFWLFKVENQRIQELQKLNQIG